MSTTANTLYSKHLGRPVVVVGGGPSAPAHWNALPESVKQNAVLVFANDHGFKMGLKPDYIVCKDDVDTQTRQPMEPRLRAYGDYPILSRHPWADVVLHRFPAQGNSGQLAIAVGALVGGRPVIPIGIDCYQQGTYFHALEGKNVSGGRHEAMWRSQMTRLMLRLEGAVIRVPHGILSATFKVYDPAEALPEPTIPVVFAPYGSLTPA